MGGITNQRAPMRHIVFRSQFAQRKRRSLANQSGRAQCPIEGFGELVREVLRRHRQQRLRQVIVRGPDDRARAIFQRKKRKRAGAKEALPGRVFVGPIRRDHRNDRGLLIAANMRSDANRGTHRRVGAIRAYYQSSLQRTGRCLQSNEVFLDGERTELRLHDRRARRFGGIEAARTGPDASR